MDEPDPPLTRLLADARAGTGDAQSRLFDAVYAELRAMADQQFRREAAGHTLQPTALVHEAYVRLVDDRGGFDNRMHFFHVAGLAMRRVLVDHARAVRAQKRGGGAARETFVDLGSDREVAVLEIEDALRALARMDTRLAEVVHLRFFAGLTVDEVAKVLGVSPKTVKRDWNYARAWLLVQLSSKEGDGEG